MHRMIIGPDSQGILSILDDAFCRLNNKRVQNHNGQIVIASRALQTIFEPVFWLYRRMDAAMVLPMARANRLRGDFQGHCRRPRSFVGKKWA